MQSIVLNRALVEENKGSIRPALRSRQFFFDVDCLLRSGAGFITREETHATRIVKINATR
jgi:hypothetical protein